MEGGLPCILRLQIPPGSVLSSEDLMEERLNELAGTSDGFLPIETAVETAEEAPGDESSYSPLPNTFAYGRPDWPARTHLLCCNCSRVPPESPWALPTAIRLENFKPVFDVKYVFCTCNCVSRWIIDHYGNAEERGRLLRNLCEFFYSRTGLRVNDITPSPPPTELRCFGGNMSRAKFIQCIQNNDPTKRYNIKAAVRPDSPQKVAQYLCDMVEDSRLIAAERQAHRCLDPVWDEYKRPASEFSDDEARVFLNFIEFYSRPATASADTR